MSDERQEGGKWRPLGVLLIIWFAEGCSIAKPVQVFKGSTVHLVQWTQVETVGPRETH